MGLGRATVYVHTTSPTPRPSWEGGNGRWGRMAYTTHPTALAARRGHGGVLEYSARTPQAPDRPLLGGGVGDGDVHCTGCHVRRNLYIAHMPNTLFCFY